MLDIYLGEDGWSKRTGEAAKNMELLARSTSSSNRAYIMRQPWANCLFFTP